MPEPRQFQQMIPGAIMGTNGATRGRWDSHASGGPGNWAYFIQDKLDLRGLMAGDENGVGLSNITLQESGPWDATAGGGADSTWFIVYDILTTQRMNDEAIVALFEQPSTATTQVPSFLQGETYDPDADEQVFNPSQVPWGMWRFYGVDRNFLLGTTLPVKVIQSGYFGTQQTLVSPHVFWTRVVIPLQDTDTIVAPCANLLSQGFALDLTTPQELTQMMRAVQR